MSDKNDGTGGIAALASWLMMTTLLSTKFVTVIIPSIADSATKTLAFNKIDTTPETIATHRFPLKKDNQFGNFVSLNLL